MRSRQVCFFLLLISQCVGSHLRAIDADEIRFSRDILPILADRCFHCHGPDASHREADLRLDERTAAIAQHDGRAAIVPGKPDASELIARVSSDDPDRRMPPPDSNRKPLTPAQIATLRQWIADGAEWGQHWSFERPVKPMVPAAAAHPIDAFIRDRLARESLSPSPLAAKHTQLRRLSFDLTGLPPTTADLERFLHDDDPQAYSRAVDRLLASQHFGERMAMWWLDAARYSDTDGFQGDATRTNWPWRDWVIAAFNANMPFDQFTIEQFAGDLLPAASPEQILATCFHRNHMTNGEGGRDPEESRVDYVIDRVNTMGAVWLGLTLGCCQCHSHKFDPVTQADYYSLSAFFNSIDEDGKAGGDAKPFLTYKSPYAERAVREAQVVVDRRKPWEATARQQAEREFEPWLAERIREVGVQGFQPWQVLRPRIIESVEGTVLTQEADGAIQASGPNPRQDDYRLIASVALPRVTGVRLEVLPHETHTDGKLSRGKKGEFILTDVKLQVRRRGASQLRDIEIASAVADVERAAQARNYGLIKDTLDDDPRNGWTTESHDPKSPHRAVFALAEPLPLADDEELVFVLLQRSTEGDANIGRFRVSVTDQPGPAVKSLDPMPLEALAANVPASPADMDAKLRARLFEQFLTDHEPFQQAKAQLDAANRQLAEIKRAAGDLKVMVLAERAHSRATNILERGVWDKKGAEVPRAVPAALRSAAPPPAPPDNLTRLDLARWLVDRENPLTARVISNHLWQICFGVGLVRTTEDFGVQGEPPSHPELLDWLAVELIDSGWDVKHLLRLIVTSDTYRQSSDTTAAARERDPDNRLLARGARFRLPSWMIRDAALASSGLLNPAVGGPPTLPYQPEGVWAENTMGRFKYEPSQGPAQFRRTVYAFWRRSSAPTFLFDSAQRRVCEVRTPRTNTPLHALTLLNDLSIREASRELARDVLERSPGRDPSERLRVVFTRVTSRQPDDRERTVLRRELDRALAYYGRSPADAATLLAFGQPETRVAASTPAQELAAYSLIAALIFNLDESMTHE